MQVGQGARDGVLPCTAGTSRADGCMHRLPAVRKLGAKAAAKAAAKRTANGVIRKWAGADQKAAAGPATPPAAAAGKAAM